MRLSSISVSCFNAFTVGHLMKMCLVGQAILLVDVGVAMMFVVRTALALGSVSASISFSTAEGN